MESLLSVFAPLIGHCFAATLSPGVVDTHCFADLFGGAHVRDTHVVTSKGKAVYSGETIYSSAGREIEFTYVNSLGGAGHGTASTAGSTLSFTGSMRGDPSSSPQAMSGRWVIGKGHYDASADGKPAVRFTLSR